jgi:hypothetical protein
MAIGQFSEAVSVSTTMTFSESCLYLLDMSARFLWVCITLYDKTCIILYLFNRSY